MTLQLKNRLLGIYDNNTWLHFNVFSFFNNAWQWRRQHKKRIWTANKDRKVREVVSRMSFFNERVKMHLSMMRVGVDDYVVNNTVCVTSGKFLWKSMKKQSYACSNWLKCTESRCIMYAFWICRRQKKPVENEQMNNDSPTYTCIGYARSHIHQNQYKCHWVGAKHPL